MQIVINKKSEHHPHCGWFSGLSNYWTSKVVQEDWGQCQCGDDTSCSGNGVDHMMMMVVMVVVMMMKTSLRNPQK